jgi:hypothetical protein
LDLPILPWVQERQKLLETEDTRKNKNKKTPPFVTALPGECVISSMNHLLLKKFWSSIHKELIGSSEVQFLLLIRYYFG